MIGKELLEKFNAGEKMAVVFNKNIEDFEMMFTGDMKANIINVENDGQYINIIFDQSNYYKNNKQYDCNSWYNKETKNFDLSYKKYSKQENYSSDIIGEFPITLNDELEFFNILQ